MLIYLAAPYTHKSKHIMNERADMISHKAAELIKNGFMVFSPITYGHALIEYLKHDAVSFEFWKNFDKLMLGKCNKMLVLCLDGWLESVGVLSEIEYAEELGIPVSYVKY